MDNQQLETLLDETFYGYALKQRQRVQQEARQFVHYTTTDAALSIINNREIWFRNSGVMNDYSEMAHGEACLRYCLFENSEIAARSKQVLDSVHEGLHERTARYFVESSAMRRAFTYLLAISEHGPLVVAPGAVDEESVYGRLSMWRAYGGRGGVALIFDQAPLMDPTDVLHVYSNPVFYGNPDAFSVEYTRVLTAIETKLAEFKQVDPEIVAGNLARFVHFTSLSCKHPGFAEEREWRITYSADPANEHVEDQEFNATSKVKRHFCTIDGLPQRIYKVPFVDYPDEGLHGITLPAILKRIVIGPTQYPLIVYDALYVALRRAGFTEENIAISISQIPLRT